MSIPILGGRLRGTRWLPASGGKLLRVYMGTYERAQTALFESLITPGQVVLDVGAHVGYYTMLAASLTGPRGHVFAFEPEPKNFGFLARHAELNYPKTVTVVNAAVGDHVGSVTFEYGSGSGTGHVSRHEVAGGEMTPVASAERKAAHGPVAVRMVTLDAFVAERSITCQALKIDVEGAEMAVLQGACARLLPTRPTIFLSTHSPELHRRCLEFLRDFSYTFSPIAGTDLATATEVLCRPGSTPART